MKILRSLSVHTKKHPLLTAGLLTVVASTVAFIFSRQYLPGKLGETLQAAAITLVFAGLLGGILKLLFDDFVLQRQGREERAEFIIKILDDLKAVFDRVDRARTVISAHRSVKTYGEEMRDLIDARVTLRNVDRALERPTDGVRTDTREHVKEKVKDMKKYLTTLTDEFQKKYKILSQHQRLYEARIKSTLENNLEKTKHDQIFPDDGEVWHLMMELDKLREFVGDEKNCSPDYIDEFEVPLDEASKYLREELQFILGGRP